MGKRKCTAVLIALVAISACTPKPIISNDQAVMYDHGEIGDARVQINKAAEMAEKHCASYGKNAIPIFVRAGQSSYECR